jgi:hypothetical protein
MHANKSLAVASDFNVVIGMIRQRSEEWWWAFAEPFCHSLVHERTHQLID